jgi:hypothetical protein
VILAHRLTPAGAPAILIVTPITPTVTSITEDSHPDLIGDLGRRRLRKQRKS